LYYTKYAMTG